MKSDKERELSRRRFLQNVAAIAGVSAVLPSDAFARLSALSMDPPNGCAPLPSGGTPFVPGNDQRPIILRQPVSSLTSTQLTKLASAYTALRALPANDKRTWLLQADLHALYCDQCNNAAIDIHGSWNFFPWHRAYLYYYERILGSLVGDLNGFRLPYWDWENVRTLPAPYSTPGSSANSLWDTNRNSGLAGGGNLPAVDGTQSRIDTLNLLTDFASFGGTASFSGSMEDDPHGTIHVDVGKFGGTRHDMGNLGFAARDPLFFTHHGNIDKLWSRWNDLASGGGAPDAYKNPTDAAFRNLRWSFYDENQQTVSISAADVLDHETNLRYTYRKAVIPRINPRMLMLRCRLVCCRPGPDPGPFIDIADSARQLVLTALRAESKILLLLHGVPIPSNASGIFDVFAVRGERRTQVGSLGLIAHADVKRAMRQRHATVTLDITRATSDLLSKENPGSLHVTRRVGERSQSNENLQSFQLKAETAEIRIQQR